MTRIALISDVHGNQIALEAVLRDLEDACVDEVLCLGDVATLGPHPSEVIGMLQRLGCKCIAGNHDAFLLHPERVAAYTNATAVIEAIDWCRDHLSEKELEFVCNVS